METAPAAHQPSPEQSRHSPCLTYYRQSVCRAAGLVFLGDVESLRQIAKDTACFEREHASELREFRLADDFLALVCMIEPDRNRRLDSSRKASAEADGLTRDRLERMAGSDPLVEAKRLGKLRLWNGFARATNYLTQSASSLLSGNTQTVLYFAIDLVNLWRLPFQYSPAQRKIRTLHQEFLDRFPDAPEAGRTQEALSALNRKHEKEIAKDLLAISRLRLKAAQPEAALFYAQKALQMGCDAHGAELSAMRAIKSEERGRMTSVLVERSAEGDLRDEEAGRYRAMIVSLAAGDERGLSSRARDYLLLYPESPFADEARYLRAVAARMADDPQQARKLAGKIVSRWGKSTMKTHARNALNSPYSNPEASCKIAQAEIADDARKFIFLGSSSPKAVIRGIVHGGPIRSGRVLGWLSPLFVIDVAVRGIKCAAVAGASNEPYRDAAAQLLKTEPGHSRAPRMAAWLGGQAADRGNYAAARRYYETSGIVRQKKIDKLAVRHARSITVRAGGIESPALRQRFLQESKDICAGTKYAGKAEKLIKKSRKEQRIVFDKKALVRQPGLWRERGLRLPPALLDGAKENGELDTGGVTFYPPDYREAEYAVIEQGETRSRSVNLPETAHQEVLAFLAEKQLTEQRTEADDAIAPKLPLELHGSFGAAGLLVYPTLLPRGMPEEEAPLYR